MNQYTRYFKILVYRQGMLDEIIPVETFADSPDYSQLQTYGDMFKSYEKITKKEYDEIMEELEGR